MGDGEASIPVDWRRNLATLWFAEFTAVMGFSFVTPFVPIYVREQFGLTHGHGLEFVSGLATGATGIGLAITGPIWGVVADRYGRKAMLVRSIVGGGVAVGLMAFARTPGEFISLRLLQGSLSGTIPAATSLVAAETPRNRVGWAVGVLTSAIALGSAAGPVIGGFAAPVIGIPRLFLIASVILAGAAVPVLVLVRERPRAPAAQHRGAGRASLRSAPPGTGRALSVLLLGQLGVQGVYFATVQLLVLKLVTVGGGSASIYTGFAFGAIGVLTAAASLVYSRLAGMAGYLWVVAAAAAALAAAALVLAAGASAGVTAAAVVLVGAGFGTASPALATMIGLESPRAVQGTVFGFSSSFIAVGIAAGPIAAGAGAAVYGIDPALIATAAIAAVLAVGLRVAAREPER